MALRTRLSAAFASSFAQLRRAHPAANPQAALPPLRYAVRGCHAARMALPTPDTLRAASFMDCVRHSESILVSAGASPATEHLPLLSALLQTSNGARGLLIALLSNPSAPLADAPLPEPVLELLAGKGMSEEQRSVVRDLLAKNVVMPATMLVHYARSGEPELREGSVLTARRAAVVARAVAGKDPVLNDVLREMLQGMTLGEGRFAPFVTKWKYDQEQKEAAAQSVRDVLDGRA